MGRRTLNSGGVRARASAVGSTLTGDEQREWAERAVSAIARALPGSEPYHFSRFLRFVPQAHTGVELVAHYHIRNPEAARVLDRMGAHHQLSGNHSESLRLLLEALRLRKQRLGRDHLDTADTTLHLAELELVVGQYDRAETLARAALHLRETQLESTDISVAQALGVLARVCTERGSYQTAEPLVRRALDAQVRRLGRSHPRVAETLSLLAEVAFMRGHCAETEQLPRRVLEMNEAGLGEEHLVTGLTHEALGTLYRYSGRDRESVVELERALRILRAALGNDHPTVLTVLNGLARARLGDPRGGEWEIHEGATGSGFGVVPPAESGISGVIGPDRGGGAGHVTFYVEVDKIQDYLARVANPTDDAEPPRVSTSVPPQDRQQRSSAGRQRGDDPVSDDAGDRSRHCAVVQAGDFSTERNGTNPLRDKKR